MEQFEYQLRVFVKYAQDTINRNAFVMYQPGYITLCYFDRDGELTVIADTKMLETYQLTFSKLYEQIQTYKKG
jgi:hypothetical protein